MSTLSISEALAEIKLIDKKVAKKREDIFTHSTRFEHITDPFEKEVGGSFGHLQRELQAIEDLLARRIKIRELISKANLENTVTVEHKTMNICSWLTWKREISAAHKKHLCDLKNLVERRLSENITRPQLLKKDDNTDPILTKLISNLEISKLQKGIEELMTIEERLDGILSMKNAQITIEL